MMMMNNNSSDNNDIIDIYIVESSSSSGELLVIIFEDKSGRFRVKGFLGHIVAQLLMCHYTNIQKIKKQ